MKFVDKAGTIYTSISTPGANMLQYIIYMIVCVLRVEMGNYVIHKL